MDSDDRQQDSTYNPDREELEFISAGVGILLRAKALGRGDQRLLAADTLRFRKWLCANSAQTAVQIDEAPTLALHSADFWLPFAVLASDVALQFYLGLAVNYVYDCLKGGLRHDKHTIHMTAVYEDKAKGLVKKFEYLGPIEGLQQCAKEMDIRKVLKG